MRVLPTPNSTSHELTVIGHEGLYFDIYGYETIAGEMVGARRLSAAAAGVMLLCEVATPSYEGLLDESSAHQLEAHSRLWAVFHRLDNGWPNPFLNDYAQNTDDSSKETVQFGDHRYTVTTPGSVALSGQCVFYERKPDEYVRQNIIDSRDNTLRSVQAIVNIDQKSTEVAGLLTLAD
jgi:hypothetical protein